MLDKSRKWLAEKIAGDSCVVMSWTLFGKLSYAHNKSEAADDLENAVHQALQHRLDIDVRCLLHDAMGAYHDSLREASNGHGSFTNAS